jgi:uncharacterized protein YjiS (DUF1127 family)
MTGAQFTTTAHPGALVPAARAVGRVRMWWRAYWLWRAREATVRILHRLDERTLRDIGIDPSEVRSVVYCKIRDRPREYDETWRWR